MIYQDLWWKKTSQEYWFSNSNCFFSPKHSALCTLASPSFGTYPSEQVQASQVARPTRCGKETHRLWENYGKEMKPGSERLWLRITSEHVLKTIKVGEGNISWSPYGWMSELPNLRVISFIHEFTEPIPKMFKGIWSMWMNMDNYWMIL